MKIEDDKLTLPPAAELQTGFDLFYQRRSLRRTYQYEIEGEQFSLTICKDQAESVDACDRDTTGTESKELKVSIQTTIRFFTCDFRPIRRLYNSKFI